MNRAEVIKKLEAVIADGSGATPGEKAAAKARLDAIRNKARNLSNAELYAVATATISKKSQIQEEFRVYVPEARKRYRAELKGMSDVELKAEGKTLAKGSWKASLFNAEYFARFKKRLRHMSDDELSAEGQKTHGHPWMKDFVAAEMERRRRWARWRR